MTFDPRTVPVRFSNLKAIGRSPAHYRCAVQMNRPDNLAMRIGRGTHAATFGQPLVVYKGKVRRGKAWDEFKAAHEGSEILNVAEYDKSMRVAEALRSDPLASICLFDKSVQHEQHIQWKLAGRDCSSRPDAFSPYSITDLKTTGRPLKPDEAIASMSRMAYHAQVSFYAEALRSEKLASPREHNIVLVETTPPYAVTTFQLSQASIDAGQRIWWSWWERLMVCESADHWPAYSMTPVLFDVPDLDLFGSGDDEDDDNAEDDADQFAAS